MSDQLIVERGGLEKKDKSELQTIVSALGGTASSRARKADLIDQILELSGAGVPADTSSDDDASADSSDTTDASGDDAKVSKTSRRSPRRSAAAEAESSDEQDSAEQLSIDDDTSDDSGDDGIDVDDDSDDDDDDDNDVDNSGDDGGDNASAEAEDAAESQNDGGRRGGRRDSRSGGNDDGRDGSSGGRQNGRGRRSRSKGSSADVGDHPVGPDGEPLADWELEVMADGDQSQSQGKGDGNNRNRNKDRKQGGGENRENRESRENRENREDSDPNNRRSRRRGRGRGRDRDDAGNDPISADPVAVSGFLDLREEGYGFLRVAGYLPSKEDVYVSVKQVRQYGLRKGDQLTGLSRPANRNEKNPGFHQIDTVNGLPPEEARSRPHFEELTPLFPDEQLVMSMREEPLNMTTRIIDLVAPIGKGQRGLIVSPPKAGKTSVIKNIARAIETNNPEVRLIVLLVDERPEEVTDMRRSLGNGEVAASTFDRPAEEHCAVAELTIERAKRMVEAGEDVCIILDGITRLARAYNLSVPQTGRAMSGGLDAGALYPPKRFLGAARNLEEGGSLTILATALVETGSRMDEVIFEEFKGTGNAEIRLDRRLAEKRIFPAIDIDGSSTRNEELLFDSKQLKQAWKLRRVLSGMSEEGTSAAGIEMLIDRLQTFKTNDDFLAEIGKAPSV